MSLLPPIGTRVQTPNGERGTVVVHHTGAWGFVGVLWDSMAAQGRTTAFVYAPCKLTIISPEENV